MCTACLQRVAHFRSTCHMVLIFIPAPISVRVCMYLCVYLYVCKRVCTLHITYINTYTYAHHAHRHASTHTNTQISRLTIPLYPSPPRNQAFHVQDSVYITQGTCKNSSHIGTFCFRRIWTPIPEERQCLSSLRHCHQHHHLLHAWDWSSRHACANLQTCVCPYLTSTWAPQTCSVCEHMHVRIYVWVCAHVCKSTSDTLVWAPDLPSKSAYAHMRICKVHVYAYMHTFTCTHTTSLTPVPRIPSKLRHTHTHTHIHTTNLSRTFVFKFRWFGFTIHLDSFPYGSSHCVNTCMNVRMCEYVHACMRVGITTCMHSCTNVCMYVHTHVCVSMHTLSKLMLKCIETHTNTQESEVGRQTERQTDRQTDRQREREWERERYTHTNYVVGHTSPWAIPGQWLGHCNLIGNILTYIRSYKHTQHDMYYLSI